VFCNSPHSCPLCGHHSACCHTESKVLTRKKLLQRAKCTKCTLKIGSIFYFILMNNLNFLVTVFTLQSKIHGYHVYGKHWTAVLGEGLTWEHEIGNMVDRYTVAVKKNGRETVGHVPRKISRMCITFLELDIQITATVIGCQRHSSDLVQGGLEIPCTFRFTGHKQHIKKLKKVFKLKGTWELSFNKLMIVVFCVIWHTNVPSINQKSTSTCIIICYNTSIHSIYRY